jgi:hypothetical protein
LQRIVIGDAQFVRLGLRGEDGFVGMHDHTNNEPIPDHISARPEGLKSLVEGMIAYALRAVDGAVDPVVCGGSVSLRIRLRPSVQRRKRKVTSMADSSRARSRGL